MIYSPSCPAVIESAVSAVPGVVEARAWFPDNGRVKYRSKATKDEILKAISGVGYSAKVVADRADPNG